MKSKIKVGAVNYLNTKPLLYGIYHNEILKQCEIIVDYPANLAKKMLSGIIDVALMPVAAIPRIKGAHIIADYGIAAEGNVASVAIFSDVPLQNIQSVFLDYQSKTSIRLAQLLLEKHWQQQVEFLQAPENYINLIKNETAGVIIGDRALQNLNNFPYFYDLSKAWQEFTGLDFIFAAWISNKNLPQSFIEEFNAANALGLKYLDEVIAENKVPFYDLGTYYTQNIKFIFDEKKIKGLELFLKMIG